MKSSDVAIARLSFDEELTNWLELLNLDAELLEGFPLSSLLIIFALIDVAADRLVPFAGTFFDVETAALE